MSQYLEFLRYTSFAKVIIWESSVTNKSHHTSRFARKLFKTFYPRPFQGSFSFLDLACILAIMVCRYVFICFTHILFKYNGWAVFCDCWPYPRLLHLYFMNTHLRNPKYMQSLVRACAVWETANAVYSKTITYPLLYFIFFSAFITEALKN